MEFSNKSKNLRLIKEGTEKCNITFIIGNGFDLGLKMKTRYIDVYDGYIKSLSTSDVLDRFKKELSDNSAHNYENWSDFEMGMALYAQKLSTENELVECVRDFKSYMEEYLDSENSKIIELINDSDGNKINNEFISSISEFYNGLTQNDILQIKNLKKNKQVNYNFITFNYTYSLERIISKTFEKFQTPIHIHGKLGDELVLGVDNTDQLSGIHFPLTIRGKRAFVKTIFNEQFDNSRVENAKKIISESSIICVYGFSMGESDKVWIEQLRDWLIENPDHHLVLYQYEKVEYKRCNYDVIMDIEDERKQKLLSQLGVKDEKIFNQIHIPIGRDIFNFDLGKSENFGLSPEPPIIVSGRKVYSR